MGAGAVAATVAGGSSSSRYIFICNSPIWAVTAIKKLNYNNLTNLQDYKISNAKQSYRERGNW